MTMNIFFSVNNAYTEQLLVAMISVLENNKNDDIRFHILSNDFSEDSKAKIEMLKKYYKGTRGVYYHFVDKSIFDGFKMNINYITVEMYYRYLIADLVPNIDKALYLDADLVVNGDIGVLYNTQLDGYYCAGVRDLYIEKIEHKEKLGLVSEDLYVNSGVMLLNLAKIREDKMALQLLNNTLTLALFRDWKSDRTNTGYFLPPIPELSSHDHRFLKLFGTWIAIAATQAFLP